MEEERLRRGAGDHSVVGDHLGAAGDHLDVAVGEHLGVARIARSCEEKAGGEGLSRAGSGGVEARAYLAAVAEMPRWRDRLVGN